MAVNSANVTIVKIQLCNFLGNKQANLKLDMLLRAGVIASE